MSTSEPHGNINRKEFYYVIKAWRDKNNKNQYLLDHETCESRFIDGVIWNNKTGEWSKINNEDFQLDNIFCEELWNKLDMITALQSIYNITEEE